MSRCHGLVQPAAVDVSGSLAEPYGELAGIGKSDAVGIGQLDVVDCRTDHAVLRPWYGHGLGIVRRKVKPASARSWIVLF